MRLFASLSPPNDIYGMRLKGDGFTLIELLIVVAVIAVLVAIAVPNYLEAQTRAKVARAGADLRSIMIGLETYRVDNSAYPMAVTFCASQMDSIDCYNHLSRSITTPIAYLSAVPKDIFNSRQDYKYIAPGPGWANGDPSILAIWVPEAFPEDTGPGDDRPWFSQDASPVSWAAWSVGPHGALSVFDSDTLHLPVPKRYWYDPTNGTVSEGIVPRLSTGHTAPE